MSSRDTYSMAKWPLAPPYIAERGIEGDSDSFLKDGSQ